MKSAFSILLFAFFALQVVASNARIQSGKSRLMERQLEDVLDGPKTITTTTTTEEAGGTRIETCIIKLTPTFDDKGNPMVLQSKTCKSVLIPNDSNSSLTASASASSTAASNTVTSSASEVTSSSAATVTSSAKSTVTVTVTSVRGESSSVSDALLTSVSSSATSISTASTSSVSSAVTSVSSSSSSASSSVTAVRSSVSSSASSTSVAASVTVTSSSATATTTKAIPVVEIGFSSASSAPATATSTSISSVVTSSATVATTTTSAVALPVSSAAPIPVVSNPAEEKPVPVTVIGFLSSSTASATGPVGTSAQATEAAEAVQLPGKKLEVLPIGLGVFAGISVIALIVVGIVTWERTKYRKTFRQRKQRTLVTSGAPMGYGGMAERA